jgi:cobalamin synthase
MQTALHEVQQSGWSLVYYLPLLAWIAGLALLAVSASRYAGVPPLAGGLFATGALLVGIEGAVASNAYFIASSAVWLAGGVAVAVALARMSNAQFAGEA